MKISQKIRILVVEDDFITSKGLEVLLKDLDYMPIKFVSNGHDAIKFTQELKPDVILMDMMIKGELNGLDTALTINSQFSIPIIFTTAFKNSDMFHKIQETGLFEYILKPYTDGTEIKRKIESCIKINNEKAIDPILNLRNNIKKKEINP